MPIALCLRCKGQLRSSFHKEPIGRTEVVSEDMKARAKEFGIITDNILPYRWCNCDCTLKMDEGMVNIVNHLMSLKANWDGYSAVPIRESVIKILEDKEKVARYVKVFTDLGISVEKIYVTPTSPGFVQFEAEDNKVYLEIEIHGDKDDQLYKMQKQQ